MLDKRSKLKRPNRLRSVEWRERNNQIGDQQVVVRNVKFDFFIPGELSFTRFGIPLKKGYPFDARPFMPCQSYFVR
jgi:hypothetical protein